MWAKVFTKVILSLVTSLASLVSRAVVGYFERRKRKKESQEAARKVEDAKTPDQVRSSIDDLP